MAHHQSRAHESASAMLEPEWSTILLTALVVVSVPVVGTMLLARPALGAAVGAGLFLGSALGIGRRVIASASETPPPREGPETVRRLAQEE